MKKLGTRAATLLLASLASAYACAQSNETIALYKDAKPYIDNPVSNLKLQIPELDGLKADASPIPLETILSKAGEVVLAQMPHVPNLIAEEDIAQEAAPPPAPVSASGTKGTSPWRGVTGAGDAAPSDVLVPQVFRRFEYVILAEHPPDGGTVFDESRKSLEKNTHAAAPRGIGFGSLWLLFVPSNIPESRFRYLGSQKIDKRPAFVVAFAQDPKLVKMPATITTDTGSLPLLYQGVLWIDQETYKIVRIRTDLLGTLPSIKLWQATSTVNYSEVEIPKFDTPLWLPQSVEIGWDLGGNRLGELHRYSKYRLFTVTSRIVPAN
jgi:hypothetical protein